MLRGAFQLPEPEIKASHPLPGLDREHRALLAQYGEIQTRCSAVIAAQAAEITRLQAQAVRLRHGGEDEQDGTALEASLVAADLVICQTGCMSHDAYWRVQDHCRRTGKQCVLVEQPQALQFVRSRETTAR